MKTVVHYDEVFVHCCWVEVHKDVQGEEDVDWVGQSAEITVMVKTLTEGKWKRSQYASSQDEQGVQNVPEHCLEGVSWVQQAHFALAAMALDHKILFLVFSRLVFFLMHD